MDFSWTPHFGMFWIFPLLCLLFMAFMMIGCGGMLSRFGHGGRARRWPRDGSPDPGTPIRERGNR